MFRVSLALVVSCALLHIASETAVAQTTQPDEPKVVLKTYDISDLVRVTQDFPSPHNEGESGGEGGAGGGNLFGTTEGKQNPGLAPTAPRVFVPTEVRSGDTQVEAICQLITDFVASDTWKTNGGIIGSISEMHGVLIVSQTSENQEKIAQLLEQFREAFGPTSTVCVRAYWLTLSPSEAESILGKGQAAPTESPVVADELVSSKHVYAQGQTTCFNKQAVHIFSGREQTVIEDVDPVVGTNSAAFDPDPKLRLSGVELQIRPELSADRKSAIVDVSSVITERDASTPSRISEVRSAGTQPIVAEFDRENLIKQQFQSTLRLPLGKKILVGGMTIEPSKLNGQQLYLVLELGEVMAE